jgi:hypothetical protein
MWMKVDEEKARDEGKIGKRKPTYGIKEEFML